MFGGLFGLGMSTVLAVRHCLGMIPVRQRAYGERCPWIRPP